MISANVSNFLKQAHACTSLAKQTKASDDYADLEELACRSGVPADAAEFRAAFMARNARVLLEYMMLRGVVAPMTTEPAAPIDADLWNRIASLDLTPVVKQLIDYQGWAPMRAASVERRYRRFLYLKVTLPEGNASPTVEVDEFWHQHIINTRRYGPDCEAIAGRFLHHTFLSPDDPVQAGTLNAVWLTTLAAYESLFEEPYEDTLGATLLQRWPNG